MEITIRDFSMESAFRRLKDEIKEQELEVTKEPITWTDFINVSSVEEINMQDFNGLGVIFGAVVSNKGENTNEVQSSMKNTPAAGAKKYKTCYLGVFDHKKGMEVVPDSTKELKGDCIAHCRQVCSETGRDIFVIIGKKTDGFNRCQAEISYKPSKNQDYGTYTFVW